MDEPGGCQQVLNLVFLLLIVGVGLLIAFVLIGALMNVQ